MEGVRVNNIRVSEYPRRPSLEPEGTMSKPKFFLILFEKRGVRVNNI